MVNICSAKSFNFSLCATREITWDDLSTDFLRWMVHPQSQTPSATIAMLVMCLEANWPLFALGLRLISVGKHKCLRSSIYPIYRYCMFLPVHPVDIRVHGDFTKSPNHGDKLSKNSVKINLKWYDRPTYQSKSYMLVNITIYFNRLTYITCWWFGSFFMFPYIGNNNPIWLIFFRGVETTNQIISHYTFNISQWNGWFNPHMSKFVADIAQMPNKKLSVCPEITHTS